MIKDWRKALLNAKGSREDAFFQNAFNCCEALESEGLENFAFEWFDTEVLSLYHEVIKSDYRVSLNIMFYDRGTLTLAGIFDSAGVDWYREDKLYQEEFNAKEVIEKFEDLLNVAASKASQREVDKGNPTGVHQHLILIKTICCDRV